MINVNLHPSVPEQKFIDRLFTDFNNFKLEYTQLKKDGDGSRIRYIFSDTTNKFYSVSLLRIMGEYQSVLVSL
jgi:hypothetical protein